jgi:L-ribulose-5-phosphate 4-epimerase
MASPDERFTSLREELAALHATLVQAELVVWTAGNVSARVDRDRFLIKPSGVPYEELTPQSMVLCGLDGRPVEEGSLNPSSDVYAHACVYRHRPDVAGVVHTHSPYATAWAARGEAIPCVLTAMADEFGGEIPVGPFALIGGEDIGKAIVETLDGHRSPAVLLRSHGVFTIGASPRAAVKAAVMCEDVARTVHLSRQHGEPVPMDPRDIEHLYDRYQNVYGQ